MTWSSSNATSCTASGGWSGSKATSGSQSTGALSADASYTLSCTGSGGTTSRSVSVSVTNPTPAPTVSLSASPTEVASGGTATLTWSSSNATACTASGAWSGSRPTAGSASTGALTAASNTFTLSCSGDGGAGSATATVTVSGATGTRTGLDFPSNGDSPSNAFVAFQFLNPQNNGLPIWGPSGVGATYIWKYRPRQQAGYYVTFWWSNNGSFLWNSGSPNSYYGAHPYPTTSNNTGTSHVWEIATDYGGDFGTTRAGSSKSVVKGQWYTQALRVTRNANGTKTLVFYTALPSVASADVIEHTLPAGYGEIDPPSPALTFGDSPWYPGFQHERLSGVLRGIKIFNKVLSEADMLAEAASDTLVTNAGQANIWYLNINPTPDDIRDKSGAGHHPAWADPNNRASPWSE